MSLRDTNNLKNTITIYFCAGMFPYVCAAMLPVFCDPKTVSKMLQTTIGIAGYGRTNKSKSTSADSESKSVSADNESESTSVDNNDVYKPPSKVKQNAIAMCLCAYTALQLFLPYSHFVTQVSKATYQGVESILRRIILESTYI